MNKLFQPTCCHWFCLLLETLCTCLPVSCSTKDWTPMTSNIIHLRKTHKGKKRKKKNQTKTCFVLSKNTAAKSPGLTQKQNPNSQIREERAPPVPREPWTLLLQGKKRKGAFPHQICWWVFCWLSFTATYPVTSVAAVNRPPLYPRGKKN